MTFLPECSFKKPTYRLSIHDSIHLVHREDWEQVALEAGPYMGFEHLMALEDAMEGEMEFRYALFHCDQFKPIGIAYFQVVELVDNGSEHQDAVKKLGSALGARIAKDMKVRSLVCGNIFHSGMQGAHFLNGVPQEMKFAALQAAMKQLRSDERLLKKPSVLIFKEFDLAQFDGATLEDQGYHPLAMDVNMVMPIDPAWKNLDGYADTLTSKARTRINAIMERSAQIVIKDLSADKILSTGPDLQRLFDNVLDRSYFVFGRLNVAVYADWKRSLEDALMFRGYYVNGVLVGFNAAFLLKEKDGTLTLDAHYVGFEHNLNKELNIYQRMLVDLVEFAMQKGANKINFGRTAEQAKSAIGAVPEQLVWYIKHRNRLANKIVGPFLRSVVPSAFETRDPFKKSRVNG